ncbi:MAG: chemotaxis-specific protein-glutamate methyltransferase CheB [Phycisphaerales bacterium]
MPTRVLIIDDSAFMRRALAALLAKDADIQVIDTARNGEEGLAKIAQHKPDVCTLDLEMPVMDGMTTLSKIKLLPEPRPTVLVCSTLSVQGSQIALKALRLGAADVICKDPDAIGAGADTVRNDLCSRVKAISPAAHEASVKAAKSAAPIALKPHEYRTREPSLVVLGSSTGGPPVLERILAGVPAEFNAPIVVAQHMPALFTRSMSERLADMCKISVKLAEHDCMLEPRTAYITLGGMHSRVYHMNGQRYRLQISAKPEAALYKPSVNELFASAALAAKDSALGIMLTGMGDDGKVGALAMHKAGAPILAQSAETCAVYGMPRAVIEAGVAHAMTPEAITLAIKNLSTRSTVSGESRHAAA